MLKQSKKLNNNILTPHRSTPSLQVSKFNSSSRQNRQQQHGKNILTTQQRQIGIPKPTTHVKRLHTPRLARTGIVGAGPTGLTIARIAQVMGYQSPITLIDKVAPARVDIKNNKRNHALMLSSQTLDGLAQVDPRLYRRLLSLGRFDTLSGYIDWNDTPSRLFTPKEDLQNPFPRWVNHLCMPRDAYGFAVMTTPLFDIPSEVREQLKKARAQQGPGSGIPKLPQVGIQIGNIVGLSTPTFDPQYKKTYVPFVKLIPDTLQDTRDRLRTLADQDEVLDDDLDGQSGDEKTDNGYNIDSDWEDDTHRNKKRREFSQPNKKSRKADEIARLERNATQIQKQLEFNLVIASDGLSSDLYQKQYNLPSNISRLLPAPNNNIRVFGWTRTAELKNMIGKDINGLRFTSFDDAFRRINSRIWIRKTDGIRFTTSLMDYPPLHLYNDISYRPKEASELPDWIYWELQIAQSIWTGQTKLPVPIAPAVNNIHFSTSVRNQESKDRIDEILGISNERSIEDGVMMFSGDPIRPKDLLQIGQLADHPLVNVVISGAEQSGLTVERSMYNPISNLKKTSFHDHVLYAGGAAFGNINDSFTMDTANIDEALIIAMSMASNANQGPEYLARSVANLVDKTYYMRAASLQHRAIEDSTYYGEVNFVSQKFASMMEKWFPPAHQSREYEQAFRYNPIKSWETSSSETSLAILQRNQTYRQSVMQGFLDGETRKVDFGDIPLDDFDLGFKPKTKTGSSPYLKGV